MINKVRIESSLVWLIFVFNFQKKIESKMMTSVHWVVIIAWNRMNAVIQKDHSDVKNQDTLQPQQQQRRQRQRNALMFILHNIHNIHRNKLTRNHTAIDTTFGYIQQQHPVQGILNMINVSDHVTMDSNAISKELAQVSWILFKLFSIQK